MENYESLGVIGEGTYGVVMKARHRETGQIVAIKKFKESDEDEQVRKTSLREVRVLKQLRHDNVITLLEVFRRKGKLHLVFEYVEKTILEVLEKKPNGLDENDVRKYMYQLLRGIEYCHSHNIIHRDVKPENILISKNGALKLCDFGFARTMSIGGKYTDYVATRWYRAPELLVGDVEYGKGVDVWAVGCIFTEISNGMPLFPGESDLDQLAHLMRCFGKITNRMVQIFRRNPLYVSAELPPANVTESLDDRFPSAPKTWLAFLKACLKNDPDQRESCSTLLSHAYFTDKNFKTEYESELRLIFEKENKQNGLRKEAPSTPLSTPEYAPALPQAQPRKDTSPSPVPGHPALGNLWSQYLASATTELPDLATNTNKPSQTTHFPSTTKPPGAQTIPAMSQPSDPRTMYENMMLHGAGAKGSVPVAQQQQQQPKKNSSLFPTLLGSNQPAQPTNFTGTYNLGSMSGSGGSGGGAKDPISSQLSYKKKPQKKNVLSTLSLTAYGGNTSGSTGSGNYDSSANGMVLFGHSTSTSNVGQNLTGQPRGSKQW